jgi:predicted double-glycine peptidase
MKTLKDFNNFINEKVYVKHRFQETDYDCGPACIKMILNNDNITIEKICNMCETTEEEGTNIEKMEKGLKALKIKYESKEGFENLYKSLNEEKPCLLRTITQEQPHWIVCYGFDKKTNEFFVLDPWLGELIYLKEEMEEIWKPRDYFYFEIQEYVPKFNVNDVKLENVQPEDIDEILDMNWYIFKNEWDGGQEDMREYDMESANYDISIKAVYEGQIIGVYSFMNKNLEDEIKMYKKEKYKNILARILSVFQEKYVKIDKEFLNKLKGKVGFQGVSLLLKPQYRNFGIGKKLIQKSIEIAKKNGADYIWGEHLKNLGNISDWTKRRELLGEMGDIYITIKMLDNSKLMKN